MSTPTAQQSELIVQLLTARIKDVYSNTIIGFTLATTVYGITVLQTFLYYRTFFGKDRWWLKCLVCLLWVLDSLGTALVAASLHTYLVSNIGKDVFHVVIIPLFVEASSDFDFSLSISSRTFSTENGITTAIIFVAQMHVFFVYQIWSVSANVFVTIPLAGLSVAAFVLGIIDTHKIYSNPHLSVLMIPSDNIIRGVIKGLSALDDMLLAAFLAYYLSSKRTGIHGTETIIDKIIKYAACRATVATLVQIIFFVTYAAFPDRTYWLPIHQLLSKVYINSVLASLNFRTILPDADEITYSLSPLPSSGATRVNLPRLDNSRQRVGNDAEIVLSREREYGSEAEGRKSDDVISAGQITSTCRLHFGNDIVRRNRTADILLCPSLLSERPLACQAHGALSFSDDRQSDRLIFDQILLLFLLDSLTTALVAASMYTHLVVNFGQPSSKLVLVPLTFVVEYYHRNCISPLTIATIGREWYHDGCHLDCAMLLHKSDMESVTQSSSDVHHSEYPYPSASTTITTPQAFLSLAALVLGIYDTNEVFQDPNLAVYDIPRDNIIRGVIKGTSALNDILIAVALIFYLRKKGLSRTFKETRTMVEKLILYIATRSGLATLAQVVYFVLFAGYPNHTYWLPAHLILSKLYVNSVMASLNVRHSIAPSRQPRHRRSDSHSGITFAQVSICIQMPALLIAPAPGASSHRNHDLKGAGAKGRLREVVFE
ncbi:hypothetical protein BDZ89DRAFT_1139687 [Hymenopellis radicata]|nr:hypothetical protein BDZ89DRAFT_1139687 [Hymenopellis radicata]